MRRDLPNWLGSVIAALLLVWTIRVYAAEKVPLSLVELDSEGRIVGFTLPASIASDEDLVVCRDMHDLKRLVGGRIAGIRGPGLQYVGELKSLESLTLYSMPIAPGTLKPLSRLGRLRELSLTSTNIHGGDIEDLVPLKNLVKLTLRVNNLSDKGALYLAKMQSLHMLDIGHTHMSDVGISRLASLSQLEELDVDGNAITSDGLFSLAAIPGLTRLEISGITAKNGSLPALRQFNSLKHLAVCGSNISNGFADDIVKLKLENLYIFNTDLNAKGLETIAKIATLKDFRFSSARVSDAELAAIARMTQLSTLFVDNCCVRVETLNAIRAMPSLKYVSIAGSQMSVGGSQPIKDPLIDKTKPGP